jgi:hypothetical protein
MKYFLISDVHGEYDKMKYALSTAGFDESKDTLVSVGDAMDRGPKNVDTLDYLLGLKNKILLWGNHDARLLLLLNGAAVESYDAHNKTTETIAQLSGHDMNAPFDKDFYEYYETCLSEIRNSEIKEKLMSYFKQCHMAAEFSNEIVTHAWLPSSVGLDSLKLKPSWRSVKSWDRWYDALWSRTDYAVRGQAYPDKKLVVGHWYAWLIAEQEGTQRSEKDPETQQYVIDTSVYDNGKAAFIDGMSYDDCGKVNVYIIEDSKYPILYDCATLPKPVK